jgi:hypothetical protein
MLITRDKAELEGVSFITFKVWKYPKKSAPDKSAPVVCGYHTFAEQKAGIPRNWGATPLHVPVMQAFKEACRFAEERGIPAIWINDWDSLLEGSR